HTPEPAIRDLHRWALGCPAVLGARDPTKRFRLPWLLALLRQRPPAVRQRLWLRQGMQPAGL
ncbi:unnamed protein product, partial [Symbiodinium necroappetens]